jgi:hypothetical protein
MSPSGYGMCGAVNQYSSKIKVGNWVEDRFGQELAAKQQAVSSQPKQPCHSVTQDAFAYAAQPHSAGEHAIADATTRGVSGMTVWQHNLTWCLH